MEPLRHALLDACGVRHGFGVRGAPEPADVHRPRQVHGADAVSAARCPDAAADAVWTRDPGVGVGVVTADCVPVLAAQEDGRLVVAIHAGWRGLSQGVIEAGVRALAADPARLCAVIGPHVGPCCYEVDAPVLDALRVRYGDDLDAALRPARPGHARLELGRLARAALRRAGLDTAAVGALPACTACDRERFHSYRRDGAQSGRLLHFIYAAD
jgi:YfiH family protein